MSWVDRLEWLSDNAHRWGWTLRVNADNSIDRLIDGRWWRVWPEPRGATP